MLTHSIHATNAVTTSSKIGCPNPIGKNLDNEFPTHAGFKHEVISPQISGKLISIQNKMIQKSTKSNFQYLHSRIKQIILDCSVIILTFTHLSAISDYKKSSKSNFSGRNSINKGDSRRYDENYRTMKLKKWDESR